MTETSAMCWWSTRTALILLLLCWGLWAPYAIREKPMPWILKAIAFACVACGVFTTIVLMPWHCEGCRLW